MPNLWRGFTDKVWGDGKEGERLWTQVQESFNKVVKSHRHIESLLIELYELDNPQLKSLMDKYEVKITRREDD